MKGLMIKDFYAMRKSLAMYIFISFGVLLTAIMFVFSYHYGNLADARAAMATDATLTAQDAEIMENLIVGAIYVMLIIPVAFGGDIVNCFETDKKAGFYNVLSTMPVSAGKIAGSRYLLGLIITGFSIMVSAVSAVVISLVSETYKLGNMMLVIFSGGALILLFISIALPLAYSFPKVKTDWIIGGLIGLCMLIVEPVMLLTLWSKEINNIDMDKVKSLIDAYMEVGYIWFIAASVVIVALSYVLSTYIIKKRKGE